MDKLELTLLSIDGKKFHDFVDALYVDIPNSGIMGILPNRLPLVTPLFISTIYYYKDGHKYYYAISGGLLNYKDSKATIMCDTYEKEDELDKERALRAKERAENILSKLETTDDVEYDDADFALKKAMNRLKLLK